MRFYAFAFLAAFLLAFNFSANSQSCDDCRYISPVFDSVTVETVHFGKALTIEGDTQQLYMDIYQPFGDTATDRPLVMFAFGGGFVQGSKDDWYVVEVCKHFTRAGYVCAAMDYRVGIDYLEIAVGQHARIFFRPMQDYRAAVQYMKADYAELGNNYNIDTNKIFAGGASAGAITALMMMYCDTVSEMEEMYISGDPLDDLGGFNSTTGFYPNYSWDCMAVVNVAGALIDASWIEQGDVPVISAHGDEDDVVPYNSGPFGGITFGVFNLEGSYVVDSIARDRGVCSYLYTMEGKNHPSEDLGLPYIYGVVYRMMLRMHALLEDRSFCCPLEVEVTTGDTVYYGDNTPPFTLNAEVSGDNGNPEVRWCEIPCTNGSDQWDITVQPDSTLDFVTVISYESGCQDGHLVVVADSALLVQPPPNGIGELSDAVSMSIFPQPASSLFTVQADMSDYKGSDTSIDIIGIDGQLVLSKAFIASGNTLNMSIDANTLASGTYFILLKANGELIGAKKVMIAK